MPTFSRTDRFVQDLKKLIAEQRQRFHSTVIDEFVEHGTIKGKGSDELEGYEWIDGKHYSQAERPKLDPAFFKPPGWVYNAARAKLPAGQDGSNQSPLTMPSTMD